MRVKLSVAYVAPQAPCRQDVLGLTPSLLRPRGFVMAMALLLGTASAGAAASQPGFSEWSRNPHSAARLIALGPAAKREASRGAAVEIRLDPGYLTYWRQPGDAGLPPTLDTAASRNVASVVIDFPAPQVFDEAGAQLFGYRDAVVLPLRVTLNDPSKPATLVVALDYAVCAAICLPGKAQLALALPDHTAPDAATLIEAAQDAVPRPATLGDPGAVAISGITPGRDTPAALLRVTAHGTPAAHLFVEGPEGWFFVAGAPFPGVKAGELVFPVAVTDRPTTTQGGSLALRLTLTDAAGAIDVPVHVDAEALKP